MKFLLKLIIILLVSSTAYSQTIDIPEETKREIIITLESYPVVLQELNVAKQLIETQKDIINTLNKEIEQLGKLIQNKDSQIANLQSQKSSYRLENKRLKRKKNKTLVVAGALGAFLIVTNISN